jgi:chaperonin GroES
MSTIQPVLDRIVVLRDPAPEKTTSGIYIPDKNTLEKANLGTVVGVGPGRYNGAILVPMEVKVGDRILFGRLNGQTIEVDKVEYTVLAPHDVLAIIKD